MVAGAKLLVTQKPLHDDCIRIVNFNKCTGDTVLFFHGCSHMVSHGLNRERAHCIWSAIREQATLTARKENIILINVIILVGLGCDPKREQK